MPYSRRARKIPQRERFPTIEDLASNPDPITEAKYCLKIALRNGGIEKMRQTIGVSVAEERALQKMVANGTLAYLVVAKAFDYRSKVLEAFEMLLESGVECANEADHAVATRSCKMSGGGASHEIHRGTG